ncbi:hypothetical protein [Telluria beijingensis]|uniref:hypothetical protein n=1 Tax=Telluria beijingensis TaxID=3068633 RepID=UPI00279614E9|nr:hypothetical protein [Massilia sp. REN29]
MKSWRTALLVLLPLTVGALAADDGWYKTFSGTYWIYGGSLGDSGPPTAEDKKIGFSLDGKAAREIFDAIGPDVHDPCTEGSGTRVRHKDDGNLSCSRSAEGEYLCNFGFDLRSGKSIGAIIC